MYPIIHEAVLQACDGGDGLSDGVIDDPRRCNFNPDDLVCQGTNREGCLTVPQVQTVKRLFGPVVNPRTGTLIYPPVEPGSELSWAAVAAFAGQEPPYANQFRNLWLKNQKWDWRAMDLDQDVTVANNVIEAQRTHALEPNLRSFADRGGKLLLYQGWSDVSNAPQSTINYYNAIQKLMGEVATSRSVRLFMAPGMGHCATVKGRTPSTG
jgi:feruloyl esterase